MRRAPFPHLFQTNNGIWQQIPRPRIIAFSISWCSRQFSAFFVQNPIANKSGKGKGGPQLHRPHFCNSSFVNYAISQSPDSSLVRVYTMGEEHAILTDTK